MKNIYLYGDINESSAKKFQAEYEEAVKQNEQDLTVYINSFGGNVMEGFGIFTTLLDSPMNITTVNAGVCASIAGVILLSGKNIVCKEYSAFMVHKVSGSANDEVLQLFQNSIEKILNRHTNISRASLDLLMQKDSWFNYDEMSKFILNSKENKKTKEEYINIYNKVMTENKELNLETIVEDTIIVPENVTPIEEPIEEIIEDVTPIEETIEEIIEDVTPIEETIEEIIEETIIEDEPIVEENIEVSNKIEILNESEKIDLVALYNKIAFLTNELNDLKKINEVKQTGTIKSPVINLTHIKNDIEDKIKNKNIRELEKEDPEFLKRIYHNHKDIYNKLYDDFYKK